MFFQFKNNKYNLATSLYFCVKCNNVENTAQRLELQKMVKEELDKWDDPMGASPTHHSFASRAASPNSPFSPSDLELNVGKKSAWKQQ